MKVVPISTASAGRTVTGPDAETVADIREAIALEAFYRFIGTASVFRARSLPA